MAKSSGTGIVPAAFLSYLSAQYPGIADDCIGYQFERTPEGEQLVTLTLVYNDSKSQHGEEV